MANGITRFFKAIWYTLTGRAHETADRMMENPEAVRGAYEDIINDNKRNIQRYKEAIGQLIALVEQKRSSVKTLTDEVSNLEELKTGAIAKAQQTAADLQNQGMAPEEVKQHTEYIRCVTAYQEFNSNLQEKEGRITGLESEIEQAQTDIDSHKVQITSLHRELDKIKSEQSEAVADLITAKEQEEIADMLSGISMDGTSADLTRMREIREKAKGRSKVAQELAGTDSRSDEEEFLTAARSSSASDEFDALIFGGQQTSTQTDAETSTQTDAETAKQQEDSDSELPL